MARIYALSDIHGHLNKLAALVARCRENASGAAAKFIFLGDYIDRGPDSRGVIEYLIDLQTRQPGDVVCLCGNHEDLALCAIDDPAEIDNWVANSGGTTLQSYGIMAPLELPRGHVDWMRLRPTYYDDGRRFFVHAGVDPSRPLDRQDRYDLLWMREPFLSDPRDYGRFVVHGHTPLLAGQPDLRANRVNIDTGAGAGGPLTAAIFDDGTAAPIGFLQEN